MAHQQESFLPFFFPSKSLLLPKPRGKKKHSKTSWSSLLSFRTVWYFHLLQNRMVYSLLRSRVVYSFLQSRVVYSFLQSRMVSSFLPQNLVVLPLLWLPHLGFKSQRPSSFAAPFLTPPTVSYTCQHPRILPALLGCHSKSGQVWPHGMEPIISKLSHRPCNQGELLLRPSLGGSHSHLPGSKQGHSYLTYL